jgi:hypothetical protein
MADHMPRSYGGLTPGEHALDLIVHRVLSYGVVNSKSSIQVYQKLSGGK